SGSPARPHTKTCADGPPENTDQTPPNQSNHSDSLPHPQDAPSCRTCAPVTANAARVLGMSHPQPNAGYATTPRHEQKGQWYSPPETTTTPPTLSPECTRTRLGSGIVLFPHQVADQSARSTSPANGEHP